MNNFMNQTTNTNTIGSGTCGGGGFQRGDWRARRGNNIDIQQPVQLSGLETDTWTAGAVEPMMISYYTKPGESVVVVCCKCVVNELCGCFGVGWYALEENMPICCPKFSYLYSTGHNLLIRFKFWRVWEENWNLIINMFRSSLCRTL